MMRTLSASLAALLLLTSGAPAMGPVPRPSPEFGFELPGGKQVLLSQYKGKVVMLAFFLTTCPHCKDTSKIVERLAKEYGPQGFQPLAACINDMAKMLTPDFIKENGLTYPVGYALRDPVNNYLQHPIMNPLYMPTIVMIDRKGTIVGQYMGGDPVFGHNLVEQEKGLRKMIEDTLKAKPASSAAPAKKTSAQKKAS